MTLLKPTIKVKRLIVFRGGKHAFDCAFHDGVNIVRGRNSTGKTTVLDLLAYSLGAENIRWKPEALYCSSTLVELELNGASICLEREIGSEVQKPMAIFWGDLDSALSAGAHEWELYPFKRSANRISFTQAILQALDLPIAQGDGASNLTLHQLMRVIYADQPSVHSPIFRMDTFDSALTREMIGGYLSGVFDDELYSSQLRVRELDVELGSKVSELRSIFHVLGHAGQELSVAGIDARLAELERERDAIGVELNSLKEGRAESESIDVKRARSPQVPDGLRKILNAARQQEAKLTDELTNIELEVADSLLFVKEIEARLANIEQSQDTRSYISNVTFRFCPSCLAEIPEGRTDEHHCQLCTTLLADTASGSQVLRMQNELNVQLRESKLLISRKQRRAAELRLEIPSRREETKRVEKLYRAATTAWSSDVEERIEAAARRLGTLDEEIRQTLNSRKLADIVVALQSRRSEIVAELDALRDRIEFLEHRQAQRKADTARQIEAALVRLLRMDLPLQTEFMEAESASFDFVDNAVFVNGVRNFSESSAVVLRHLFHLAILTASVHLPYMRFPRLLILDGIDDGGMEKSRSHRLQEIIVEECATYEVAHQVIFATSEINPALEGTDLVVGRYFTPELRSLEV